MISLQKPRLIFMRFISPGLPQFIISHLEEQVTCLEQFFDVAVIQEPGTYDYDELCDRYRPDITMLESGTYTGAHEVRNVHANPHIPKVVFLHCDAYCRSRQYALVDVDKWEPSAIFTLSVSISSYLPTLSVDVFTWPNFANTQIFRKYELPKTVPVLFTGSQALHYPWRNRVNRAISHFYPTLQTPHFGWHNAGPAAKRMLTGEAYARLISAAWVAPACGTIANDIVRKHFEIPACGTCLITQKTPAIEAAGFRDNENCLFADEHDVIEKLDALFRDSDAVTRIAEAGYGLVAEKHTMGHRSEIFQWYQLHKRLVGEQRIIQPSPFSPLSIAGNEENKYDKPTTFDARAIDRILLRQGYKHLEDHKYAEAASKFRQCLNYHYIPEPIIGLALCALYTGKPDTAIDMLSKQMQQAIDFGSEPDAIECAYYLVALLCKGRKRRPYGGCVI